MDAKIPGSFRFAHAPECRLQTAKQRARLGHTDGALAKQKFGYRAFRFARKLERIARRHPMIDDEAREQESSSIAAPFMDAVGLPCQRNRACDMIEQAGGASRLGLVLA